MQGEPPSHPELLDWLSVRFVESGWDIKALVRLIVSSGTYRQSAHHRPDLREFDPQNRLLAAQNPRRLDAEFVRDNALFAAGLLNLELGGPSGHPYQPDGYYASLNFPARRYKADTDDRQYRRGLYMHWQRTFLHPMLANFDAPSREECVAARNLSTTPQQALTLLNDPSFVEAARVFAERVLADESAPDFRSRLRSRVHPFARASGLGARTRLARRLSRHTTTPLRRGSRLRARSRFRRTPVCVHHNRSGRARCLDAARTRPPEPQRNHRALLRPPRDEHSSRS